MAKERELLVYSAKLAEQAERYEEMVEEMKKVAKLNVELTAEERNLLSIGYKNVIGATQASWSTLSSIEEKETAKHNEKNVEWIIGYKHRIEDELSKICSDILSIIDEHLLPYSSTGESIVFYHKMKGDYYLYLAESKSGDERKQVADQSLKAYEAASSIATSDLPPTHPIRLGLALNFSVFYYEILNSPKRACHLAKHTFHEAIAELDSLNEESYKDSTLIMQLLRENLTLWTSDLPNEEGMQLLSDLPDEEDMQLLRDDPTLWTSDLPDEEGTTDEEGEQSSAELTASTELTGKQSSAELTASTELTGEQSSADEL